MKCRVYRCIYRPYGHLHTSHVSRLFVLFDYLSVLHEFRIVDNVRHDRRHHWLDRQSFRQKTPVVTEDMSLEKLG